MTTITLEQLHEDMIEIKKDLQHIKKSINNYFQMAEEHLQMKRDVSLSTYHQRLEKIKTEYPHAYELWGSEDIKKLIHLFGKNKPIDEIAKLMGRQNGGIRSQLKKLNLIEK